MSSTITISLAAPKAIAFTWFQAGQTARLDCTGFSCVVGETTLPFTPTIDTLDAPEGEFRIRAFTSAQAAQLQRRRSYRLEVILRNGAGAAIEDFDVMLKAV